MFANNHQLTLNITLYTTARTLEVRLERINNKIQVTTYIFWRFLTSFLMLIGRAYRKMVHTVMIICSGKNRVKPYSF